MIDRICADILAGIADQAAGKYGVTISVLQRGVTIRQHRVRIAVNLALRVCQHIQSIGCDGQVVAGVGDCLVITGHESALINRISTDIFAAVTHKAASKHGIGIAIPQRAVGIGQ